MKINELIDATIGVDGARAQLALCAILGEEGFNNTLSEVRELLIPVTSIEEDEILHISLNKDQGRVLASFFVMGISLIQAISEGDIP